MNRRKIVRILTEAAEKQPELKSSCDIQVDRIIALLHVKALEKVPKEVVIENTAVEGTDEGSAKFHGAGEHMISARSAKEGESIDRKKAFEAIVAYVSAFLGPDVSKKIKEDDLIPDVNGGEGEEGEEGEEGSEGGDKEGEEKDKGGGEKDKGGEDEEDEELDESEREFSLSFLDYLKRRRLDEDAPADKGGDEARGDGGGDETYDDDDDDDETVDDEGDDETQGDKGDDETQGDKGDDETQGDKGGDEDGGDGGDGENTAKGYYITYVLEIEGQKPRKLGDMLKDFGSALMKNFGLRFISGWGDTTGEKHSFKEIADELGNVFGKVDLDSFVDAYKKNLEDYYKGATDNVVVQLMETAVIKKYCREWIKSSDVKMLDTAKFVVCTRFNKNDKAPELMKPDIIVKAMNESIGSIFKKLRMKLTGTAITEKSVIFIQNYAENVRDKKRTKYNKIEAADWDEHTPDVKESLDQAFAAMGRLEPVFTVRQDDVNRRLMLALFEDIGRKRARRLLAEADDEEFTITYAVPKKPLEPEGDLQTKKEFKVKKGQAFKDEPDPQIEGWVPEEFEIDDPDIVWKYVNSDNKSEELSDDALKDVQKNVTAILMLRKSEGSNSDNLEKLLQHNWKEYFNNLKKKLGDKKDSYFQKKKFLRDFEIGKVSVKKDDLITCEDILKIVEAFKDEPDRKKKAKDLAYALGEDALKLMLDVTGDSKEHQKYGGGDAYGSKTEWFMYIVPMPGGDRKNDDDNEKEGVEAK